MGKKRKAKRKAGKAWRRPKTLGALDVPKPRFPKKGIVGMEIARRKKTGILW